MEIAALVSWVVTALGGFVLLFTWFAKGGGGGTTGHEATRSRLRPTVVLSHFLLAAVGLVLWVVYVVNDNDDIDDWAFRAVVLAAILGFVMFFRWVAGGGFRRNAPDVERTPENHFPLPVVVGHGVFAALTLVLVALTVFD